MLARMKHINRWGLMRNTRGENVQEHSLQAAMIAHALALISNRYFGGCVDADRTAVIGMFHDCDEILTGDLPTPIKYFNSTIRDAYREVESAAADKLLSMLPEPMRDSYGGILGHGGGDPAVARLVKAADTICAHIKCIEELAMGNSEFAAAAAATKRKIDAMGMPEADLFMRDYIGAFGLSLDEFGI
ncbi:MAG: 5'-deoxynucleotidase [Clostridiales bacterium]|jgi:5'-deoxynucleotidase|nr:5'-deoxynucleotidase [Clostridiales bacterium]